MALVENIVVDVDNVMYQYPDGVKRKVQGRLEDYVSVMDFGAKGDGVTDDSDAIIAALAASTCVVFPGNHTYSINKPITGTRSGTTVVLDGAVIKPTANVITAAWPINNCTDVTIQGGLFEGTGLDNSSGNGNMLVLTDCQRCRVVGGTYIKSAQDGVRLVRCSYCTVQDVMSFNNLSQGIHDRDGIYNSITGCKCIGNGSTGVVPDTTGGRGILMWRCIGTRVTDCTASNNTEYGIRVYSQSDDTSSSSQILISDCHAADNLKIDIYIYNEQGAVSEVVISNPMIRRTTQPQGAMMSLQGSRVSINGGSLIKSGERLAVPCISVYQTEAAAIRDVTAGNVGQFISLSGANDTLVQGCVVNCAKVGFGGDRTTYIGCKFTHGGSGTADIAIDANTSVNHIINCTFLGFQRCISWNSQAMVITGNVSTGTTDVALRMFGDGMSGLTHAGNAWDTPSNPAVIASLYRTTNKGRAMGYSNAAPTTLTWIAGDIIWNINPSGTNFTEKWVCTESGTPGTWVAK